MNAGDFILLGLEYAKTLKQEACEKGIAVFDEDLIAIVVAGVLQDYHKALMSELHKQGIDISDIFNGEREYHYPND